MNRENKGRISKTDLTEVENESFQTINDVGARMDNEKMRYIPHPRFKGFNT